jgi:hypothetical protein
MIVAQLVSKDRRAPFAALAHVDLDAACSRDPKLQVTWEILAAAWRHRSRKKLSRK